MYQAPDQLIALNKANIETALRFAGVYLEGAERIIEVQLKAAKSALADGFQSARALASVHDLKRPLVTADDRVHLGRQGDDGVVPRCRTDSALGRARATSVRNEMLASTACSHPASP